MTHINWTDNTETRLEYWLIGERLSAESAAQLLGYSPAQTRELVAECRDDSRDY